MAVLVSLRRSCSARREQSLACHGKLDLTDARVCIVQDWRYHMIVRSQVAHPRSPSRQGRSMPGEANPAAFACGQLAQSMVSGYFSHRVAMLMAADERVQALPLDRVATPDQIDGHQFDFRHFLRQVREPELAAEFERVWLAGALVQVGNEVAQNGYFDHAPEIELVRHLRNGVAHGNRFDIRYPEELKKWPAHNHHAWVRGAAIEITPELNGTPVLFNFISAGDVLRLLTGVSLYLIRMGNGDPLRPEASPASA